ncbi:hypothetical protein FACS189459_6430 [Bacilli bacterium]|nr:hypothetical protein FACS189459_6430 [Bacilli bacterium]GHU52197.1 hypothetical protein FACS189496_1930 [Bacilli bacterium]
MVISTPFVLAFMDILIKTLIDVIRVDNPSTLSQNDIDNLQHLAGQNGDM